MTTFELQSTSTVYMDGTAIYHVRRKGKPGIVCTLRIHMGEVERIEQLLLLQAEAAWGEGFATGKSRAMRHMSDEPSLPLTAPNPYTAYENNK